MLSNSGIRSRSIQLDSSREDNGSLVPCMRMRVDQLKYSHADDMHVYYFIFVAMIATL